MKKAKKGRYFLCDGEGNLKEVSEEVYQAYYHAKRRERYQEEQKHRYGAVSLDAIGYNIGFLNKGSCAGSEIENAVIRAELARILEEEIGRLSSWDKRMVGLLYISGLTVKDTAGVMRCSRGKIFYHRKKILARLRWRLKREGYEPCDVCV